MATLGISLNTIGISQAKGVELIAQREQLDATLPRGNASAQASEQQPARPAPGPRELTPEQQRQVAELQQIDRTVRAHEQAHLAAGRGVITSAANFSYTYGPDGRQYAVGGEVGIDTSAEKKPEANIDKGVRIQAAALAPKDPSPQDYRVASIGGQLEAQGRSDLAQQQAEQRMLEVERGAQQREQAREQTSSPERQRIEQAYAQSAADSGSTLNVFA